MSTARELHRPRRYRLLAKPPFDVSFPSIDYRVEIVPVPGAPQWRLVAWTAGEASERVLCQAGERVEWLERDLYERGFEVMWPTAPGTILEKMCAMGVAERVDA